ncbi:MAG: hypothetical protein LBP96_02790, partial [Bacteroidales bacterium]|jgi:hypothetical protein|nr:hypothetical protein [Bacteroidales bacterium]
LYSYPVIDQQNFYLQESSESYIQLKRDLGFLFDLEKYDYSVRFEGSNGVDFSSAVIYNLAKKRIEWEMPELNTETNYTTKIIGTPRQTSANFTNISENYTSQTFDNGESFVAILNTVISETSVSARIIEVFSYTFRTSVHPTFATAANSIILQKATLQSLLTPHNGQYISIPDANYLFANSNKSADFDEAELFGTLYTQGVPLVKVRAVLDAQNTYFTNHINPLIYQFYNYNGLVNLQRNSGQSLLPTWAMTPLRLSANPKMFPWTYDLPLIYKSDLQQIQVQLANQHAQGNNISAFSSIFTKTLPPPIFGTYRFSLQYNFPCGKLGTFSNLVFNYTP